MSVPCSECGFDPRVVTHEQVPDLTRDYASTIAAALECPDAKSRPEPRVWSRLEYGCHARDVCIRFAERLQLMLVDDDPLFADWDQNSTAIEQQYWTQDPDTVAGELHAAAGTIADTFAGVTETQWLRPGRRSNGTLFTVDTLARYFLHDLAHHAWDVTS